jgi:hypothetical protein
VKAARPRSEGEVSCGNTGIDSNLGEGRAVTLKPYPTTSHRLKLFPNVKALLNDLYGMEPPVLFAGEVDAII